MIKYNFKALLHDKEFKEDRKITYDEIAKATGLSRQTLSNVSSKRGHNVTADVIERLCRYFEVSPSDLMTLIPDHPDAATSTTPSDTVKEEKGNARKMG